MDTDAYPDDFFNKSLGRPSNEVDHKFHASSSQHRPMTVFGQRQWLGGDLTNENTGRLVESVEQMGSDICFGVTRLLKLVKDWTQRTYKSIISVGSTDENAILYWARLLDARKLQAVKTSSGAPSGFIHLQGIERPLDFAVYSNLSGYCFNLPADLLRPEVLAALKTGPHVGLSQSKLHESLVDPSQGVKEGLENFWIQCLVQDLQILLRRGPSIETLDAVTGPIIDLLPDDWFKKSSWKKYVVERLCDMLSAPILFDLDEEGDPADSATLEGFLEALETKIARTERSLNLRHPVDERQVTSHRQHD